jgi:hypothetical protein
MFLADYAAWRPRVADYGRIYGVLYQSCSPSWTSRNSLRWSVSGWTEMHIESDERWQGFLGNLPTRTMAQKIVLDQQSVRNKRGTGLQATFICESVDST